MPPRPLAKRRAAAPLRLPFPAALLAAVLPSFVLPLLPPYACFAHRRTRHPLRPKMSAPPPLPPPPPPRAPGRSAPPPPPSPPPGAPSAARVSPKIVLTAKEREIFGLLLRVLRDEGLEGLTLRVAGGWVRDKVLGRATGAVDIDIALDTQLGAEFAATVNGWLARNGLETHSVGVIQRNPEQSKHLETATMRVLGVPIDLVNLRTETYAAHSRIPAMKIGTPAEDARRRDLTINSLFYNINTAQVEDFTGYGLADIAANVVRTPLPPKETLLDDPLRALRAVRFASRLNFKFDRPLFEACKDPQVRAALSEKVSRERVAAELDGMVSCARPVHAIGLLVELRLFPIVFRLPERHDDYVGPARAPAGFEDDALGTLMNLEAIWKLAEMGGGGFAEQLLRRPDNARLLIYTAILVPLKGVMCKGRKGKPEPVPKFILSTGLKMSSQDTQEVLRMHQAALAFKDLVKFPEFGSRLVIGRILRKAGPSWRQALQIALAKKLEPGPPPLNGFAGGINMNHADMRNENARAVSKFVRFWNKVEGLGLDGVWDIRPLVDGNALREILPGIPNGPKMGEILYNQTEYMIKNRNTDVEAVTQWLISTYPEFRQD